MITFNIDKKNNILFIKVINDITPPEVIEILPRIYKLCKELPEGFVIINDLSSMVEKPKDDFKILSQINKKTNIMFKVAKTIRIIGKSKANLINMSTLDKENSVSGINYVASMKDALDLVQVNT